MDPTSSSQRQASTITPGKSDHLLSLDAYRGFTMLLLAFTVPNSGWEVPIAEAHPDSTWLAHLMHQFEHVEWQGIVLWDMIQPSFMFMVGVSMAYSYASRKKRGHTYLQMFGHAVYRAIVLILLGVFLRSLEATQTYWTLEDVVTQIGLGYVPLFLLWGHGWKVQLGAAISILVGYWLLFALWPLPPNDYDFSRVSGKIFYEGFLAHWNMNAHPAHYFDQCLLNLFPRKTPFVANEGGYNTLNFVPSLTTMIAGLIAGEVLRLQISPMTKVQRLLLGGTGAIAIGFVLQVAGICPIVKRIWTPSFSLVSTGLCLFILALLYYVIDVAKFTRFSWPARIVGMNSVAMYCMTYLLAVWLADTLQTHLGTAPFAVFGEPYQPFLMNMAVGTCLWLICFWMYQRKLFLKI